MKKKSFISKFKNVITSADFTCGFKRMNIAFLSMVLCFTLLCLFDCLPTANALVTQQEDFHTIDGCWYSLTPSTLGDDLVTHQENNNSNENYTRYCYTLVDDNDKIVDKDSYQYIVNDSDEVYVFEYYTWLDSTTTDTKKIAVYSQTGLKQNKDVNGKLYYSFTNGSNGQYVFESIDDYLYYRLYRYLPDWQTNDTVYYSQDDKLTFDDNEYFGYKLLNDDVYNTYKNIDVYTEYKFEVGDVNYIKYSNISVDSDGNIIAGTSGSTDTSEYQIINRSDLNQLTYVLERQGDAYVTTDVNGIQIDESGFSTKMYYAGGQMYIYDDNFQIDTPNGKQTVSGFKIYSILTNEAATLINYADFDIDKYTMIKFDESTNELIVEAERYYDLYEITYEMTQISSTRTEENKTEDYIANKNAEMNCEVSYDEDNPSQYILTYNYTIQLRNEYAYKIKYEQMKFKVGTFEWMQKNTDTYSLTKIESNKANITTSNYNGDLSTFENASKSNLEAYISNEKYFYNLVNTTYTADATLNYGSVSITDNDLINGTGNASITSTYWSGGSTSTGYVTNIPTKTYYSTKTYSIDSNGLLSYTTSGKNAYLINGVYYTGRSSAYKQGYRKTYKIEKVTVGDNQTSLPSVNSTSSRVSISNSSYYNVSSGNTYKYGLSYTSTDASYFNTSVTPSSTSYPSNYLGYNSIFSQKLSDFLSFSYNKSANTVTVTQSKTFNTLASEFLGSGSDFDYYHCYMGYMTVTDDGDVNEPYYSVENVRKSSTILNNYNYSIKLNYSNGSSSSYKWLEGNSVTQSWSLSSGYYPTSMVVYIPVLYYNSWGCEDSNDINYYYHAVYNVSFVNKIEYDNVYYYKCTFGATSSHGYYLSSYYSTSTTLNTSTGTKYFYYQAGSSSTYYKYSSGYTRNSTTVTYNKAKQRIDPSNIYAQTRTIIPAMNISLAGLTGTNIYPLSSTTISTIKTKIMDQITALNENSLTDGVTLNSTDVDASSGKITVNGSISKTIYNGNGSSIGTATYNFTVTQEPTGTVPVTTTNYYDIYQISKSSTTGNYTEASSSKSTTTSETAPNTSTVSNRNSSTELTSSSNTKKVFTITNTYEKQKVIDYVSTGSYSYAYSNSNTEAGNTKSNGNFYINGLPIYTKNLKGNRGYKYISASNNTDVGETVEFTKTFTVEATEGTSNKGTIEGSYADYRQFASSEGFDISKVLDATSSISNTINLYDVNITRYTFDYQEIGKEYAYGSTSSNFGTNNVKVSSYYDDIEYDNNGKITNRSDSNWNGTYTLPTSYNLFNETVFFNNLNVEKRVTKSNGIYTYTLYKPLNLYSALTSIVSSMGSTTRTYYLSYYLNGTKVTKAISGNSKTLNYFNVSGISSIGSNTTNGYTISQVMFTTDASKAYNYTKYAKISTNKINDVDDYAEKIKTYDYQIDYKWYETDIKATSIIANLGSLIDANGKWTGVTPIYQYTINGNTFTYSGDTINYTRGNEYTGFNDSTLRMVYKSKNQYFGYYLTKNIVVTESELGVDYYNISQAIENGKNVASNPELAKQGIDGTGYYNYFQITEPTITNTKAATIKINANDFATGSYVSKNSAVGKLALYYEKFKNLDNIYLVYNRINNTYKLIKPSQVTNYKYEVYYDANKVTSNGGLTFTYGDAGFTVENGEFLQLRKGSDGKAVKDLDGNYIYDIIYRSSLVENAKGTLDNLISNGINNYVGTLVSNGRTSTSINSNNIVDKLVSPSDASLSFNGTNITDSTNSSFDYNGYSSINGTEQFISSNYVANDKNYLLLLESTINNGIESSPITINGITYNGYVNAYYQSNAGDMYRLKNDTSTLSTSYGENYIPKFSRYKQYLIEGRWQKSTLEDYYYQIGDDMPTEITNSEILYSNFLDKQWNLGNGAYLGKVSSIGSEYDGLLIGQDIDMAIVDEDGNYSFEYYNEKENTSFGSKVKLKNYLASNSVAEYLIENKTNSYYESKIGSAVTTKALLVKKDKVKIYSLTKKIPYNLVTIVEEANIDSLSTLDMRYQFNATQFMADLKNNTDAPIYIKADDLSGLFTINGLQYEFTGITDGKVTNVSIYNGTVAASPEQGIIKPGIFTTQDGTKYIETIYYGGRIYQLGSIVGEGEMSLNDFSYYAAEIRYTLASILTTYAHHNPNNPKDAVGITNALAGNYYTDDFQNFIDNIGLGNKSKEAFDSEMSNLFASNLFTISVDLNAVEYDTRESDVDVIVGGSTYYDDLLEPGVITVKENSAALTKINRSSDYIRIGNACYYAVGNYRNFESYRGVDCALDNADISNYDSASFLENILNINVFSFLYTLEINKNAFFSSNGNELAYIVYSDLIDGTYSKVKLDDIFEVNTSINQYFIEVELGVDAANNDFTQIYNLPFTNVEYTNASKSGTANEKNEVQGVHFYNLSGAGSNIRYIITNDPKQRVMSTAAAWYESMLEAVIDPIPWGTTDLVNAVAFQTEDLKLAYGYENSTQLNEITTEAFLQNNEIYDSNVLKMNGKNISSNEDWLTDTTDVFYSDCLYSDIDAQFYKYNTSTYSNDASQYIYSTRNVGGEVINGKFVGGQNYVMKFAQYNAELPWFSDASNWVGNTQQFFQDVANTVKNAFATAWKWLWSGGKDVHTPEEDGYFQGTDHFAMTFYQLPTYSNPNLVDNEFSIWVSSNSKKELDTSTMLYTIIDNDYSPSTSFNLKIDNLSDSETGGLFWGFELYADAPEESNRFNGWTRTATGYYYIYDKRLSSKGNINLVLQEKIEEIITIDNLPAEFTYYLRLYTGKDLIEGNYNYETTKVSHDVSGEEYPTTGEVVFKTGKNLIYNPYNTTLSGSEPKYSGDKYLAQNQYIDYEVQKFIFNADNINNSSYTNNGYVNYNNELTGENYQFSSKVLMQKYLNTENVSKIAFYLKASGVNYLSTSQYMVWDISTGKTVAKGMLSHSDDNYKDDAYLDNVILYDLTTQDKLVLQNQYNNEITSSFINNYLLKDKLVFHVKNTGGSTLDTSVKFEILWQPFYEDTLAYLDYNQNGKYDDAADVKITENGVTYPYYNESALAVSTENATETRIEYDHLIYGSSYVNSSNYTNYWKKATFTITKVSSNSNAYLYPFEITYANENGVTETGWYQLCIIKDGESHILK